MMQHCVKNYFMGRATLDKSEAKCAFAQTFERLLRIFSVFAKGRYYASLSQP